MVNKLFMVAAGHKNSYPSYNKKNKIFFIDKDPSSLELDQPYLCSPIFSLKKEGYRKGLDVNSISEIKFYMIPRVFPSFGYILQSHSKDLSQIWSTIGLANLVVFNFKNGKNLIAEVDESLKEKGCFITASEKWDIENGVQIGKPDIRVNHEIQTKKIISFDYQEDLPDYIKFVISEYKISAQKILDAARVFTPYHYSEYLDIFEESELLIGSINALHSKNLSEASEDVHYSMSMDSKAKQAIINEKHGRLVQLNSALSYVYSQCYSGSFPIFDHYGIIRRYSLLGIGVGINALYELLSQMEELFVEIPFELTLDSKDYDSALIEDEDKKYLGLYEQTPSHLLDYLPPNEHTIDRWKNDILRKSIISNFEKQDYVPTKKKYFNRFTFFSGRLGFREYDFSATSAIQVLISGRSLQWNIINYTHEIIHNHARHIINKILNVGDLDNPLESEFFVENGYSNFIKLKLEKLKSDISPNSSDTTSSYKDFFLNQIFLYCIFSKYFGSLSKDFNINRYTDEDTRTSFSVKDLEVKNTKFIIEEIKNSYRDISEIFVHVLDFKYIYDSDPDSYLQNIWASWITVPIVMSNLRHYILRSLLVLAIDKEGSPSNRFRESVKDFRKILLNLKVKLDGNEVFEDVIRVLNDEERNMRFRFQNCILIADMVNLFFTTELNDFLKKGDNNAKGDEIYDIEVGDYKKFEVNSKVRFAFGQLKSLLNTKGQQSSEWDSAWLLQALSSSTKNFK